MSKVRIVGVLSVALLVLLQWGAGQAFCQVSAPVTAAEDANQITMSNGIVSLTISKSQARGTSIQFTHNGQTTEMGKPGNAFYFDSNGGAAVLPPGQTEPKAGYQPLGAYARSVTLASSSPESADAVLDGGPTPVFPFETEVHLVLRRGDSGFYAYVVFRHGADMPAANLGQTRFVMRGPAGTGLYTDHDVDADRKGPFPTSPPVRQVMDATSLLADGAVYTKYNNTAFLANHHFHGMTGHGVGIWTVTPSNEYVNGGPIKQELTVHMDNTLLSMLIGGHFGSGGLQFAQGEPWRKVFGPFFVYMNSGASNDAMFADAEREADRQEQLWPYAWLHDADYPLERALVTGKLRLTDGESAAGAWVVLAAPGGDWPLQGKGYEFWAQADQYGNFAIPNVRLGTYALYAYGADQFEQLEKDGVIVTGHPMSPGEEAGAPPAPWEARAKPFSQYLGVITWRPVTHGRTLWQIGVADRSTREFKNGNDVRHWANYLRYPKDFPDDVTFVIGKSREAEDWNYAQWTWYCRRPYWTIQFDLPNAPSGICTLTLGICSSQPVHGSRTNWLIQANGTQIADLQLTKSGAAAYRSGGEDSLYQVEYVTFNANLLKAGTNEITLGDRDAQPFPATDVAMEGHVGELMYDAIRLEVGNRLGSAKFPIMWVKSHHVPAKYWTATGSRADGYSCRPAGRRAPNRQNDSCPSGVSRSKPG